MDEVDLTEDRRITPNMTVLDVIDRYRNREAVFRKYDEQAGACICCWTLFDTVKVVSEKYGLDLRH
jgi:hypothetical protein